MDLMATYDYFFLNSRKVHLAPRTLDNRIFKAVAKKLSFTLKQARCTGISALCAN